MQPPLPSSPSPEPTGTADAAIPAPVPRLVVRTVELAPRQLPERLVDLLPSTDSTVWSRENNGMVGWGTAARLDVDGPDRFAAAARWWEAVAANAAVRADVDAPGAGLVAFGSFAFAHQPGASTLVVPEIVVGRRGGRAWLTTISTDATLTRIPQLPAPAPPPCPEDVTFADGALSGADWAVVVGDAVRQINDGQLDKVVLARELRARADRPIDLRWPLARLTERYPTCWTFSVDGLFGATPEMLVRRERGLVTSRVLAGTIRRTGDDAHDLALAASLARSSKDLEEHEYAVRSVAEALAPHCSSMNVPESPFVLHLANVMHLATDVAGVAEVAGTASSALQLAAALHPSAAVCGTPTETALDVIAALEGMDRGRYAGPVGWIDAAGDGEWGIALRCALHEPSDPRLVRLYAGCGIVAESDPAAELAESQAKLIPVRDALQP